ncbi:probable L-type lectin-domain containing receptor kinase VII.2 [Pyrus communis]|uniref:probable L-type lectin-domain containing receptor kinase VII.2 n=1 Tax=Pyrus communis TaxID=23211 RepID=UPI0035BFD38B
MLFNQKGSKFNKKTILFSPFSGLSGASSAQHLGFFNFSNNGDPNNNIFGVEFDVFENQELQDPDDNHVGLDINSLTSNASSTTGYWSGGLDQDFNKLKLNNGINYQVWIDFMGSRINVTMARAGVAKTTKSKFKSKLKNEAFIGTKPPNTSSKKFKGRNE